MTIILDLSDIIYYSFISPSLREVLQKDNLEFEPHIIIGDVQTHRENQLASYKSSLQMIGRVVPIT